MGGLREKLERHIGFELMTYTLKKKGIAILKPQLS